MRFSVHLKVIANTPMKKIAQLKNWIRRRGQHYRNYVNTFKLQVSKLLNAFVILFILL